MGQKCERSRDLGAPVSGQGSNDVSLALDTHQVAVIRRERRRFATGAGSLLGVRPEIASSWARCRDSYGVDPALAVAPPAEDAPSRCLDREVLLTELGGMAAALAPALAVGVVTVVDGEGRLMGSWGEGRSRVADAHLAPWYAWSERASGTNGMGTALLSRGVTVVRGPEHWCEGFHGLDCLGVPIIDPVTRAAGAAVNVSAPTGRLPADGPRMLRSVAARMHERLSGLARERAVALADAFERERLGPEAPALVLDESGRVVLATPVAGRLLGIPSAGRRLDPDTRLEIAGARLDETVAHAAAAAHAEPGWSGSLLIPVPGCEPVESTLRAVMQGGHPMGFVLTLGAAEGDVVMQQQGPSGSRTTRVVAHRHDRVVLLRPEEIRAAEADGNAVWLLTDRGRLRAADRGLTNLETTLRGHGFLRVHRRHLVNVDRIVEVSRGAGGGLLLFLDPPSGRPVPVSRARASRVREHLGL